MISVKSCRDCGGVKPLTEFHVDSNNRDGHRNCCKTCIKTHKQAEYQRNKARYKAHNEKYRAENRSALLEAKRKDWELNGESRRAAKREHYAANKNRIRAEQNEFRKANPEVVREWKQGHYQKHKGYYAASSKSRKANKLQRTPAWADNERIQAYYDVCAFFNEINGYAKYHVDHIVPLQGKTVSGLHVHNNLQVIPAKENLSKGNRHG